MTTYKLRGPEGCLGFTDDAERAERLSRAGFRVTAVIE